MLLCTAALKEAERQDHDPTPLIGRHDVEPMIPRVLIRGPKPEKPLCMPARTSVKERVAKLACLVPREESFESVLFMAPVAASERQDDSLAYEARLDVDAKILVLSTSWSNPCHISGSIGRLATDAIVPCTGERRGYAKGFLSAGGGAMPPPGGSVVANPVVR